MGFDKAKLDALFEVFRKSDFLNIPLWEAKKLGLTPATLRQLAEGAPEFEIVRIAGGNFRPFDAVRAVLTPENLALLAPVSVERLRKAYARDPEGMRRLEEVLAAGGENGPFHIAEDEVRPGPGVSVGAQIAAPRGYMPQRLPVEERGELRDEDLRVLSHLEDLEEERINFGLYDTFVSADEIRARIAAQEPGLPASDPAELAAALERLINHRFVLSVADDRYRSRISETVRVLKRVKQRFDANDMTTAPYLVHSIRVRFQDRRRLARNRYLSAALQRVFEQNRGGDRRIDGARKAVERGFAEAVGRPPEEVTITAVQERALEFIAGKYFSEQGHGVVITGNTGSGKTEAAVLPLLLGAVEEKLRGVEGCKVLLVYPRQELAKNQLQRLSEYLARINRVLESGEIRGGPRGVLSAGIVFGGTPADDGDLIRGSKHRRAWRQEGNGYVLPYFTNEADGPVLLTALDHGIGVLRSSPGGFDDGGWELEGFRATRQAVLASPPDVLVITTEMLHRWLMEPGASSLFGLPPAGRRAAEFAPPRAILFDEIHLYDTIHGAQIGMLLRRLRHRMGVALRGDRANEWAFPLVIGMSATIGTPRAFWSRLSGLPEHLVDEFSPDPDQDLEAAQGREYFLFIRPETYSRGRQVGDAAAAIQSIMAVAHNMVRRGPAGDQPPKHRSLVFQDSISKVRKLTIEFRDAETNRFLAQHRLARPADEAKARAVFAEGDYWLFDAEDPFQYGQHRTDHGDPPCALTSDASPVFSGSRGTDRLKRDIVFATSVLEVGYDDPSIQFVFQHHAPRNAASFVQKKGRAGRSLQDRPITGVTLSRGSYRDAFFYQNPHLLYDPADYRPPLNVDNYFVQRFQALALLFDELVRLTGRDFTSLPPRIPAHELDARLEEVNRAVRHHEAQLQQAFAAVTGDAFRRVHPTLLEVWEWFLGDFRDREVRFGVLRARNLLRGHPDLPENLFSTLNLPTLRVMYRERSGREEGRWKFAEEDVALAFWEIAPGKVTRRYGRGHALYWRAPASFQPFWRLAVAIERSKRREGKPDGPFDPTRLKSLPAEWGPDWASLLPAGVRRVYGEAPPERFYRARFVELWDFGTLDPRDPRRPQPDWRWWGRLLPDGSVRLTMADVGRRLRDPWRRVSPDSTSYPLSCAVGGPLRSEGEVSPASDVLRLPPLFPGLIDGLHVFAGEVGGRRSALAVWEVHYAAEARVILLPGPRGKDDPHAGTGTNLVRYENEHDQEPTLYGYDLTTEGVRVPFNEERLAEVADSLFEQLWNAPDRQRHLQDQYLRYLLKSEKWPLEGAAPALNAFDLRIVADLISTMRAETRAQGMANPAEFLARLTDADELMMLVEDMRARYWRDHRVLNDAFVERLVASLTLPGVDQFLAEIFGRIGRQASVKEYLQGVVLHSLKHAVRHLFVTEGSTRDEEVGSFGLFRRLTHPDWSPGREFYVYERNQDGSGATRLVRDVERDRGTDHLVRRWWDVSLACPVGDEEDFFRAALLRHGDELRWFANEFLAAPVEARRSPKEFLAGLFPDVLNEDEPLLGHLAGVLTSELSLGGENGIPLIDLHAEVYALERELADRFGRPPTDGELAGYAATAVEGNAEPRRFPALSRLRDLYHRHAATIQAHDDEGTANELDRFLDQVGHLSLQTCVDACPACLASNCRLGHIETMRHALSRRYLKEVHRILSAPSTVEYQPGTTVEDLVQASAATGGWTILVYHERLPEPLVRAIRGRFDNVARIFDHERIELRRILHLREGA